MNDGLVGRIHMNPVNSHLLLVCLCCGLWCIATSHDHAEQVTTIMLQSSSWLVLLFYKDSWVASLLLAFQAIKAERHNN